MKKVGFLFLGFLMFFSALAGAEEEWGHSWRREKMVEHLLKLYDVTDPKVLEAMRKVGRHLFVPPAYVDIAY